jgi:hypothetical protein
MHFTHSHFLRKRKWQIDHGGSLSQFCLKVHQVLDIRSPMVDYLRICHLGSKRSMEDCELGGVTSHFRTRLDPFEAEKRLCTHMIKRDMNKRIKYNIIQLQAVGVHTQKIWEESNPCLSTRHDSRQGLFVKATIALMVNSHILVVYLQKWRTDLPMMSTSHSSDISPLLSVKHTAEPTDNTALHYV